MPSLKRRLGRIEARFEAGGRSGSGWVEAVSLTSLRIRATQLPSESEAVGMELATFGDRFVGVSGRVRRVAIAAFEVEIEEPSDEYLAFYRGVLYGD